MGETYLIGDDRYVSLNELVRRSPGASGSPRIVHLPFAPLWVASALCEAVLMPLRIEPPLFRRRADWFRQTRAFTIDKAVRSLARGPRAARGGPSPHGGLVSRARVHSLGHVRHRGRLEFRPGR